VTPEVIEQLGEIVHATTQSLLASDRSEIAVGSGRDESSVISQIAIRGGWNGILAVACEQALACRVASVMFGIPAEQLAPRDIQDAMAELANIIGGNFKSLLSHPDAECTLSLPQVVDHVPTDNMADVRFEVVGSSLRIYVKEGAPG
jgi:chemotaxis protein CheX